jgi:hypothetical protein
MVERERRSIVVLYSIRSARERGWLAQKANRSSGLSIANEHWNEGAVVLGYLNLVDTQSIDHSINDADRQGAWGLQIRSPQNKYTGVGFF